MQGKKKNFHGAAVVSCYKENTAMEVFMYQLYGHKNSGAAAIEAALELCEVAYRFIDVELSMEAALELQKLNPLKQIPTLQLPDGSILTESAAILIHLGLAFPKSSLLPNKAAERDQAIRGLVYIVSNCLSGYIENFLNFHQLNHLFQDFECSGNTSQPKTYNIQQVIERNQLQNPIYIGDTHWDAEAADNNTIPFVYASYGFGIVDNPKFIVQSFDQLLQ